MPTTARMLSGANKVIYAGDCNESVYKPSNQSFYVYLLTLCFIFVLQKNCHMRVVELVLDPGPKTTRTMTRALAWDPSNPATSRTWSVLRWMQTTTMTRTPVDGVTCPRTHLDRRAEWTTRIRSSTPLTSTKITTIWMRIIGSWMRMRTRMQAMTGPMTIDHPMPQKRWRCVALWLFICCPFIWRGSVAYAPICCDYSTCEMQPRWSTAASPTPLSHSSVKQNVISRTTCYPLYTKCESKIL